MKLNAALGGILDFKLAGEDAVRGARVPIAVVRPCALTEEPRGMPLEFGQGDVIKVRACVSTPRSLWTQRFWNFDRKAS